MRLSGRQFPQTGIVIQSCLKRTEVDAQRLLRQIPGAIGQGRVCRVDRCRVPNVAGHRPLFLRSLAQAAHGGDGIPLIATHDPRLIEIAAAALPFAIKPRAQQLRIPDVVRVRPEEQKCLSRQAARRCASTFLWSAVVPYLVRRMAEKPPANLALFVRHWQAVDDRSHSYWRRQDGEALLAGLVDAGHSVVVCETDMGCVRPLPA